MFILLLFVIEAVFVRFTSICLISVDFGDLEDKNNFDIAIDDNVMKWHVHMKHYNDENGALKKVKDPSLFVFCTFLIVYSVINSFVWSVFVICFCILFGVSMTAFCCYSLYLHLGTRRMGTEVQRQARSRSRTGLLTELSRQTTRLSNH
jgi:hypothetical protein